MRIVDIYVYKYFYYKYNIYLVKIKISEVIEINQNWTTKTPYKIMKKKTILF